MDSAQLYWSQFLCSMGEWWKCGLYSFRWWITQCAQLAILVGITLIGNYLWGILGSKAATPNFGLQLFYFWRIFCCMGVVSCVGQPIGGPANVGRVQISSVVIIEMTIGPINKICDINVMGREVGIPFGLVDLSKTNAQILGVTRNFT